MSEVLTRVRKIIADRFFLENEFDEQYVTERTNIAFILRIARQNPKTPLHLSNQLFYN
jgi:hypothetical protein